MYKNIDDLLRDYDELGSYDAVAQKHGCSHQYIGKLLKGHRERSRESMPNCDLCGGKVQKNGKRPDGRQSYRCPKCKKYFLHNKKKPGRKPINGTPLTPTEKHRRWKANHQKKRDRSEGNPAQ